MEHQRILFIGEAAGYDVFRKFAGEQQLPYRCSLAGEERNGRLADDFDIAVVSFVPGDAAVSPLLALLGNVPLVVVAEAAAMPAAMQTIESHVHTFLLKDPGNEYVKRFPAIFDRIANCRCAREQNRILAQVVTDSSDIIYVTDAGDKVVFVNRAFQQAFGYTETEACALAGSSFWKEWSPGSDLKNIIENAPRHELRGKRKDGSFFPASVSRSVVTGADGRESFIAVVARDATESKQAQERFTRLLNAVEQTPNSVMMTDRDGAIEYVNPGFEKLTGYSREEVLGKTPRILKSDKLDPSFYQALWKKLLLGDTFRAVFVNKKKSGELFYQEETITPIKDETGQVVRFVSTGVDISETKRMEEALQEANEKLIVWVDELEQRGSEIFLLSEMADLLQTCLSPDEAYAVIGESLKKLFPNDAGAVCVLRELKDAVDVVASWGDASALKALFTSNDCWAMRRGRPHVVEDTRSGLTCKHLAGTLPPTYMCLPMMAQSESLGILYLQNNPGDLEQPKEVRKLIVESKQRLAITVAEHIALALANIRLRDTLRNQAIRDPLTGLFNRRYMEETLEREMAQARREKSKIGIIMLDIDFFKRFNDNYGHAAGDAMLRALGDFLKRNVRASDIACRYGGEEFTLILPGATLDETANRAHHLQTEVKKLDVQINAQVQRTISLSLGVACFPDFGADLDEVLRAADAALYRAKAEGRDRVVVFEAGMKDQGER